MTAHYIVADVFEALAGMPDNSVDLILTSPPFLALRSYLPADHPDKGKEIGSEPSPADFIDTLLDLTEEWRRVLAPHGSLCVELGDTFSGSGGAGGDYADGGLREGQQEFSGSAAKRARLGVGDDYRPSRSGREADAWPLPKSLCGIPELYRLSLAYGRNMLRPERTIEPWRVRNVIRWCRPNPPVGALGDKFRPATSDMVVACTSGQRWFDLDAVRQPLTEHFDHKQRYPMGQYADSGKEQNESRNDNGKYMGQPNPAGAPPLDWWQVSTEPYKSSHYATWPRALLTRPIQAMCPIRVCRSCGEPSRRILGDAEYVALRQPFRDGQTWGDDRVGMSGSKAPASREAPTLGWTDCGHGDNWRNGIVLDPFAGSGTTLAVATGHGRDAIGIDLDARNLELARDRVGPMWFTEGSPFIEGAA
jgi:site-specific DNA-methyltransferase (cytosine-N4-specific)